MTGDLEQALFNEIWARHDHCEYCDFFREGFFKSSCTVSRGADCPYFQQELSAFIEGTFDPDEWKFFNRYNNEDAEGLFLAFYRSEFPCSLDEAVKQRNLYQQVISLLKEQS